MANLGRSDIPWMEDNVFLDSSTKIPKKLAIEEEMAIGTIIIIVISVIFTISALFAIAIFLDCRHQKLTALAASERQQKKIKISRFGRNRSKNNDAAILTENAQLPGTSTCIQV